MNRYIPDGARLVERNGHVFIVGGLFDRFRYDPLTLTALAFTAIGTVQQIKATRQAGDDAKEIAQARAEVDIQNADAVDAAADEEAKIRRDKGRRLIEEQKSGQAAGGIRLNVGSPLVIETETNAAITRDIGFALKRGRTESDAFRSSAGIEIAGGKAAKKQSRQKAIAQGIQGFGSIAFMAASVPGADTSISGLKSTTDISRFAEGGITRNFPTTAF